MAQFQTTVEVPASPETAFAYLADLSNAAHWDPSIVEAERLDDGEIRVGSRFRLVAALFGRRIELTYAIEELVAPSRVVFAGIGKSVSVRDTITVEPADTGARVTYDAQLRLKGAMRLLDKGMQMQFTTMSERAIAGVESVLA